MLGTGNPLRTVSSLQLRSSYNAEMLSHANCALFQGGCVGHSDCEGREKDPALPCGRERKKAKAQDLEKTVAALSEQLQSMAGVKQENSELQDRNLALVNRLRSKEEELERMLREQARLIDTCKRVACRTDDMINSLVSAVEASVSFVASDLLVPLRLHAPTRHQTSLLQVQPMRHMADRINVPDLVSLRSVQAAQPAYMKTGSGRVVELAGTDEAETSVKEVESLSNTYQATVRARRGPPQPCTFPAPPCLWDALAPLCAAGKETALRWVPSHVGESCRDCVWNVRSESAGRGAAGPAVEVSAGERGRVGHRRQHGAAGDAEAHGEPGGNGEHGAQQGAAHGGQPRVQVRVAVCGQVL